LDEPAPSSGGALSGPAARRGLTTSATCSPTPPAAAATSATPSGPR